MVYTGLVVDSESQGILVPKARLATPACRAREPLGGFWPAFSFSRAVLLHSGISQQCDTTPFFLAPIQQNLVEPLNDKHEADNLMYVLLRSWCHRTHLGSLPKEHA